MNRLLSSDKIYIASSKMPQAGRGVFAKSAIKKGELIERCPVIEIPRHDEASVNESMLVTYIYYLGQKKDRLRLALGFGSIYNHSYQPNAVYKANDRQKVIDFLAIKDIKKDDEIVVNYNQASPKGTNLLWFE